MSTTQPAVAAPSNQRLWIFDLTAGERSTLVATFGGWALDGMDVMVYSFVIPSLIAAWHISKSDAGWLGTAALLMSSLGGWLAGLMADRFGRVRVLQITIVWFAVFTFLSGFTQEFLATAPLPRVARFGVRRRVGGGLGADGRNHPRATSRQSGGNRARRLGGRLGHCRVFLHGAAVETSPATGAGAPCSGSASCPRSWCFTSGRKSKSPKFIPRPAIPWKSATKAISWKSSAPRC